MNSTRVPSVRRASRKYVYLVAFLALVLVALLAVLAGVLLSDRGWGYASVARIRPLLVLYGPGVGDTPLFSKPMGVAFAEGGRIYVADTGNNRIVVFDKNGRYLFQFGGLGVAKPMPTGRFSWKPGKFNYPTDVAVDSDGLVYVADFRNDQIQVFDEDGKFLRVFPDRTKVVGKGAMGQEGTGIAVTSVAVGGGRVYATDTWQIMVFSTEGELLDQFGKPGDGPTDLDHPNGSAVDLQSTLVVSDSNHGRLLCFGPDGRLLWTCEGTLAASSSEETKVLEVPRGLTYAADGSLVVAEALESRLVRVSAEGKTLGVFGQRGDGPGELNFPMDVAAQGQRLAVADKGNNRVQILVLEDD